MMQRTPRGDSQSRSRALGVFLTVCALVALTGCSSSGHPTPQAASPSTAGSTVSPKASGGATPFSMPCDAVVPQQALENFNPQYAPQSAPASPTNNLEKLVVAWKGTLCVWKNTATEETLRIAIAKPPTAEVTSLKDAAITVARPVPTYGNPPLEGYFTPGEPGQAQIFTGPFWIVAQSTDFAEPGDAQTLLVSLVAQLNAR